MKGYAGMLGRLWTFVCLDLKMVDLAHFLQDWPSCNRGTHNHSSPAL